MHSFTNSIPILVLLGASAIASPILQPAVCVIDSVTYADPCTVFAQWRNGQAVCPESMAASVFGELLTKCCNNDRRVNEDNRDGVTGAIQLSNTGSKAPHFNGLFNSVGGTEKEGDGIDVKATMDGNGSILGGVANGVLTESSGQSGTTGNLGRVGPHRGADVNADIAGKEGNSDNSQDGSRLSAVVSGNNHLTDLTGNEKTDTSDGARKEGLTQVEVEKQGCNVNPAASIPVRN